MFRKKLYLVVALILALVAGFFGTSLTSYFFARDSIATQISEQSLPLTSDNIYSEIQRDLLRPVLISSLMASDTFLRDWVLAGEQDSESIRLYLAEIQKKYDTITAFFISESTRNYYHSTGILRQVDINTTEDAWYGRVRSLRDPYEINVDNDTFDRSRISIFINYRVFDYSGNYLGVTGVGLAVDAVTQLINNYQQRYGRTIYFVDRQGNITLTGPNNNAVSENRLQDRPGMGLLATQVLSNPSTAFSYTNENGEKVFLNSRLVPEFDWYLMVEQTETSAANSIEHRLWINGALALGIVILVLFGAQYTLATWARQQEEMATTDRLTGVGNRHLFEVLFDQACKRAIRDGKPICFLLFDIDNFRKLNDTWGHHGGDVVLQQVAKLLKSHVRNSDVVCRWDGEEFLVVLENCDLPEASELAQGISRDTKAFEIPFGRERLNVTVSAGLTRLQPGDTMETVTTRVDGALQKARQAGGGSVNVADDVPDESQDCQ